jgi:hypothetical protein
MSDINHGFNAKLRDEAPQTEKPYSEILTNEISRQPG